MFTPSIQSTSPHHFTSSTPNCNPHTPNSKEEQGRILDGNRWHRLDGEGCYKEDSNGGFTGNNDDELMNTSAGSGKAKDRVSEDSFLLVSRNSNTGCTDKDHGMGFCDLSGDMVFACLLPDGLLQSELTHSCLPSLKYKVARIVILIIDKYISKELESCQP